MKIEFIPSDKTVELVVQPPKPAKEYIPKWYKNISNMHKLKETTFDEFGQMTKTIKECIPFVDAYTTGYIQETWTDIHIDFKDGQASYNYPSGPNIIEFRNQINVELSTNYEKKEFMWCMPWIPKLPKGYSLLITNPFNHFQMFTTLTGVVDADSFYHTPFGRIPFYIHKGFKGIIPTGTPMFQIIPFKRDSWNLNVLKYEEEKQSQRNISIRKHFFGAYKNHFWSKKEFN